MEAVELKLQGNLLAQSYEKTSSMEDGTLDGFDKSWD